MITNWNVKVRIVTILSVILCNLYLFLDLNLYYYETLQAILFLIVFGLAIYTLKNFKQNYIFSSINTFILLITLTLFFIDLGYARGVININLLKCQREIIINDIDNGKYDIDRDFNIDISDKELTSFNGKVMQYKINDNKIYNFIINRDYRFNNTGYQFAIYSKNKNNVIELIDEIYANHDYTLKNILDNWYYLEIK